MQRIILIRGIVQGLGIRPSIHRIAVKNNIKGYVRNTPQGIEILACGKGEELKAFISDIKALPEPFHIESIQIKATRAKKCKGFKIEKSTEHGHADITIPPDIAICKECIKELYSRENRRYRYWFITCTNCGPRFSIIKNLPYDRENTTMGKFGMCRRCEEEYSTIANRRYHAQTIACYECGPRLALICTNNKIAGNCIEIAAKIIKKGGIIAMKGVGGWHLACLATSDSAVKRLRKGKMRANKPFAVMVRDVEMAKRFCVISKKEKGLLESYARPIVLLRKSEHYNLSKFVAPGLHNVGVFLPYTGMHYLLFDYIKEPVIMTSANLSGEPTIIDDKKALTELKDIVDCFLIHDRDIANRCDDSVIRVVNRKVSFIRRARGFVPLPLKIDAGKHAIICMGSDYSNTFCIYKAGKAYISSYNGDIESITALDGLEKEVMKFLDMLKIKSIKYVVCDLHPRFNTSNLASKLAKRFNAVLLRQQHHIAHFFSCMQENNLEKGVGIVCDGFGYGSDGKAWGGEVFLYKNGRLERVGMLETQAMIGGDYATKEPLRLSVAVMSKFLNEEEIAKLIKESEESHVGVWLRQLENKFNIVETTSCGRFLDAVSAFLGICKRRSYEGEPAMKLESIALKGKRDLELPVKVKEINGCYVLSTTEIFKGIMEHLDEPVSDIALSVHYAIGKGLAKIAKRFGMEVCFSGGVAYNEIISKTLERELGNVYRNKHVPCGDGGISFGQLACVKYLRP
ncbi:MAG TPA: carbamoyltransferase HypF [Candidatus Aenigmarchaeota archaeon]|nr:carbamoyltransferase HypF [Candidatus Aenigmarchaeota archaeon]